MSKRIYVRPGKTQSKFGVGAGLIFCLIGVFIVSPTFGLFGVFWTAIAGWITYTCYRNGFTDEQIDSHVIEIEDDDAQHTYANTTKTMSAEEAEERLRKLQNLYNQSLITYEEYEQKKQEILDEL